MQHLEITMKVDVMQVDNAVFKYRYSFWSLWIDIAVFDYSCTPFLLQMKVNRFNGKAFKSICISGKYVHRQTDCHTIGDLMPTGK